MGTGKAGPVNNCRRVVVVRYMCGGMAGCAYYKREKGRRSFMGQHCEYRCYKTEECLSGDAKAAADVAGMILTDEKGARRICRQ